MTNAKLGQGECFSASLNNGLCTGLQVSVGECHLFSMSYSGDIQMETDCYFMQSKDEDFVVRALATTTTTTTTTAIAPAVQD